MIIEESSLASHLATIYAIATSLAIPLFVQYSLKLSDQHKRRRNLGLAKHPVFLTWTVVPVLYSLLISGINWWICIPEPQNFDAHSHFMDSF
ncbi:MAG: hypothetical protein NDF55_09830 [archaeon GB-1867-005]|nr:hypothetical protein [Candidatus Culexmicrobium cathedralense]